MKSNFSEQELKERALELLYGLLEENEAEELRRLIASDATAARIFDEAREAVDRFARAARWEEAPEADVDEATAKNVAVETVPFDGGAAFLFDAFSTAVDAETSETEEANAPEADVDESSGSNRKRAKRRRNPARKERRREKAEKTANAAKAVKPVAAARFRFGAKGRVDGESGWATVGRTSSGARRSAARRFLARVPKPTLFQNLIIALAFVALSTAVGFWAQESALQARFRDDFRIQIAAPRTLARGESQTIAATTTAPNGKPRRVPIRFSFSDAETGAPLLAHTESGDASGVARFKIPDVSDFPARTLLTISAGEQEKETFETVLTVVDAPKGNVDANAAARFAASETVGEIPPLKRSVRKSTAREAPKAMSANVATLAATPEDAGVGMADVGAMGGGMSGEMEMGVPALEAARAEALTDALALDDRAARNFDRAPAAVAKLSAFDDESKAELESAFRFSLSGASTSDDENEETTNAAPAAPAFNFADAFNACEAPAEVAGMNGLTAAARASSQAFDAKKRDAPPESALAALKPSGARVSEGEEIGEPDSDAAGAAEKRGIDVRFYPVGGRLVAGRENVAWFECVDADGRPVAGEFALNNSTGRVATAKTSEGGVGSLRWTPDVDETYSLETAFDGEIAKIVENDKSVKNGKEGEDGDADKALAEEAAADKAAEANESEPRFETFSFPAPTATVERVAFSVPSRVLESGKGVELEIWCENDFPLAASVEKNGVALAQRVWTAKKGRRRVVLPLDADVSGVLNVSLWNCARTPFERIGSAAVYRKPAGAPTLDATLERNDDGERALQIAVERKKDFDAEESVWLKAFWAPTLDEALAELKLDETLLYASDERRVETLATLEAPTAVEPVLFDNLLEMKENALEKLNAFWLGEAGTAGRVVALGFVGCGALALLTVFCVLLGALKARRGAVVVLFCAALATLFYFERRRIDFSETLSQAIAVSVDESKAALRRDAIDGATDANAPKTDAEETAATSGEEGIRALFWLEREPKPANAAEWNATLPKMLAETDVGFILAKVYSSDGTPFAWKAIPLAETDGEAAE